MVRTIISSRIPEDYCACAVRKMKRGHNRTHGGCGYHLPLLAKIRETHCFNMADEEINKWWYTHIQKCSNPQRCFFILSTRYG